MRTKRKCFFSVKNAMGMQTLKSEENPIYSEQVRKKIYTVNIAAV